MRKRAARLAIITSALALVIAGCSSVSNDQPGNDQPGNDQPSAAEEAESDTAAPEPDPKADEAEEKMDEAAGPDADEVPYDDTLDVIASRDASFGDHDITLDLNQVRVSGELMTVLFTVTNTGDSRWQIASSLDSGEFRVSLSDDDGEEPAGSDSEADEDDDLAKIDGGTTDGVVVTDDANGMVYRAAYDNGGNCLCSSNLSASFVDEDKSLLLNTRFAAPPEDVESVTVQIPHFGTFDDVPLSR